MREEKYYLFVARQEDTKFDFVGIYDSKELCEEDMKLEVDNLDFFIIKGKRLKFEAGVPAFDFTIIED